MSQILADKENPSSVHSSPETSKPGIRPLPDAVHGRPLNALFQKIGLSAPSAASLTIAVFCLAILYYTNLYSFLLFHVLIEIFSVLVAFAIFIFAWNTRTNFHNQSIILLGAAFLAIGAIDLLHTFSYKGMGIFTNFGANTATQLWVAARYLQSLTLAAAPLLVGSRISMPRMVCFYLGILMLVILTVFFWPVFPTCYVEGAGQTAFKKNSEYIISIILLIGLALFVRRKQLYDTVVFRQLVVSILLTIVSELMFTFYISVFGISNMVGHLFKLGAYWLIYKAIIETGLQRPLALLFRELAQSEQRYRDLVVQLPTGICEITPDQRVTYINPAGLRIFGFTEEDVRRGISLDLILETHDQERARKRMDNLLQGRAVGGAEYTVRRKDGSKADIIVYSFPIHENGKLKTIQTSMTDVTEFKRLQSLLQEAQKVETVAVLAGGMAHEINNKLMGIVGRIEILRLNLARQPVSDEDLGGILGSCDRIAALIKYLLAYARGGRYRSKVLNLTEFIPKTVEEIRKQLNPQIRLTYDIAPGLPEISADPVQLQMVLEEIVRNSAEAIETSGCIEVTLRSCPLAEGEALQCFGTQPGNYLSLEIRDTGRGMKPEMLPHIFEPFYTDKFMGRGLGLAAVYGIVKNHGGWIGVESEPGRGTRVRILLPVAT